MAQLTSIPFSLCDEINFDHLIFNKKIYHESPNPCL